MEKDVICIICPQACLVKVEIDSQGNIVKLTGDTCKKGARYVKREVTHPERMVTATMMTEGSVFPLLPVKTDRAVPKEKIKEIIRLMISNKVRPPVAIGQVIISDILGTGANVIATRNLKA